MSLRLHVGRQRSACRPGRHPVLSRCCALRAPAVAQTSLAPGSPHQAAAVMLLAALSVISVCLF